MDIAVPRWSMGSRRTIYGPITPTSPARHLRDLLRSEILANAFPTGKLPGESELTDAFDVSRATVRGALSLLREEGIIDRVQGLGTIILTHPTGTRHSSS